MGALIASGWFGCSEQDCPNGYERYGTKCFAAAADAETSAKVHADATIPPQACDRDTDCTHGERSRCDLSKGECAACTTNAECSRAEGAPVCIAGVGCFPCSDTDTSKCPGGRTLCETTQQCVKCVDTCEQRAA